MTGELGQISLDEQGLEHYLELGGEYEPIRIGVLGLGYWGPNIVRNLSELAGAEVVCACDPRAERLRTIRRRHPAMAVTRDVADVVFDPDVDAVAIATPVATHYELARAALEAGKHVFVEKPLASSSSEAVELLGLAARRGLVLMPGHTFVYSPSVNLVRSLIGSGELGRIYFLSMSRVNLGLHQPDASVVWDLGPHDFSILLYWLGETPTCVTALSRSCVVPGTPDVAFINAQFDSGAIAHIELSWLAPSKLRRTTIVGSDKMIVYDDTAVEPVRVFDSGVVAPEPESFGEYQLSYRTGDVVSPRLEAVEPLYLELEDFCNAIRSGEKPRSSAELGLEVVRVIEAVDQSLARRGSPVTVRQLELAPL